MVMSYAFADLYFSNQFLCFFVSIGFMNAMSILIMVNLGHCKSHNIFRWTEGNH